MKDANNEKVITRFFVNNNCELRTFYITIMKGGDFNYSARQNKSYHNMLLETQNRNYREKLHLVMDTDKIVSFMAKAPRNRYFFRNLKQASGDVKMELLINANRYTITRSIESTKFLNTLNKEIEQCKNN